VLALIFALAGCSGEELPAAAPSPVPTTAAPTPSTAATCNADGSWCGYEVPTEETIEPPKTEEPAPEPTKTKKPAWRPSAEVDWENHAPAVKKRIDKHGKAKDCDALQADFDTADMNDTAQRNRTGDGNADLLEYIDEWLRHAGCYR
jgi:hypothetical protein